MSSAISIIIPCYNQGHFLTECVESVLSQDFNDWEMLIVNDGSTDDTLKLALDFASKDKRINVIDKENGGLSSARNAGIQQAKGTWLLFLDADDYLLPTYFQCLSNEFEAHSAETLIQYGYQYVEEESKKVIYSKNLNSPQEPLIPGIFKGNIGPCHSLVISTELVGKIGDFDESLKSAEDWDFWIRAAKAGAEVKQIEHVFVAYRYSKDSMSRNAFRMYEALKSVSQRAIKRDARIQIETKLNHDYDYDYKSVIKNSLLQCLGVSLMQGKVEESSELFRKETTEYSLTYQSNDFAIMCSYLSFRYWYSKEDLKRVFNEIYPSFSQFFDKNPIDGLSKKELLTSVFRRHLMQRNRIRFGLFGVMANRLFLR
ncbi:glycosyltransferase family 2 protein [Peijinzhouia sedimentorum]